MEKSAGFCPSMVSNRQHHHSFPMAWSSHRGPGLKGENQVPSPPISAGGTPNGANHGDCVTIASGWPSLFKLSYLESGEDLQTTCGAATLSRFQPKSPSKLTGELEPGNNRIRPEPWVLVTNWGSSIPSVFTSYSPHNDLRTQGCYLHFIDKETEAQRGFMT